MRVKRYFDPHIIIFYPYTMRVGGSHLEYVIAITDTVEADGMVASV